MLLANANSFNKKKIVYQSYFNYYTIIIQKADEIKVEIITNVSVCGKSCAYYLSK